MLLSLLFATLASLSVSGGDFVAGLASRRTSAVIVAFVSESVGLILLALSFLFPHFWPHSLSAGPLILGFAAGVCATFNIILLYHGFAVGTMSIVAPLEAVVGVSISVIVGLASGDPFSSIGALGILCAISSPLLLANHGSSPETALQQKNARSIMLGIGSGLCLGGVFVFLGKAGSSAGLAPLFMERVATVSLTGFLSTRFKAEEKPNVTVINLAVCGGILDIIAHALYFISTWYGALSMSSVIYSLYPVGTILLGRAVLKEQLAKTQIVGVISAICGITLLVYNAYP